MATIPDITVPSDEYIDLYLAASNASGSSITVGTALDIINKGGSYIYVQESATQPVATSTDGTPLTPIQQPWAVGVVAAGSAKIWVKASDLGRTGKIQVIVTA